MYQTYLVLAVLRQMNLLEMPRRGSYQGPANGFPASPDAIPISSLRSSARMIKSECSPRQLKPCVRTTPEKQIERSIEAVETHQEEMKSETNIQSSVGAPYL